MFLKLWKRTKPTHRLMAMGDVVGGFGIATLVFTYAGPLEQLTLGWVLILISIFLHIPYFIEYG